MPKRENADHSIKAMDSFRRLIKNVKYREGVIAQVFYVGAQIMCWTFIIHYADNLGIPKSTAYEWSDIYINLVEANIPWDQIAHIGWTKIRLFAKCLTKENWKQWIDLAEKNNASVLRKLVSDKKKAAADSLKEVTPDIENKVSTHVENEESLKTNETEGEIKKADGGRESEDGED